MVFAYISAVSLLTFRHVALDKVTRSNKLTVGYEIQYSRVFIVYKEFCITVNSTYYERPRRNSDICDVTRVLILHPRVGSSYMIYLHLYNLAHTNGRNTECSYDTQRRDLRAIFS